MSDEQARATPPAVDAEIYDKLVQNGDDILGLLAYGRFKQSERDWISRFHARHGRGPTTDEISNHFYLSYDEGDIERLRTEAESMMTAFAFDILDDERPHIEETATRAAHDAQLDGLRQNLEGRLDTVRSDIRKSGGFWRSVLAGVISSFVFILLTLAFVAIWFAPGLHDILKGMVH